MRFLLFTPLFLLVAACATDPAGPRLYLMEADAPAPAGTPAQASVGLREVALPLYARRQQIAARDAAGAITAADEHRWAEDPSRAVTRLVARTLAALRGAPVYPDPWPQGASPDLIATVEVDRFLGEIGGEVALDGQITLARMSARGDPATGGFAIRTAVVGADHAALAAAYGAALAELAREMDRALREFEGR
ncbi:MAG: ABC-type transport auxiliary lipoprotein family protein [Paracoccaceae bacterium]